MPQIPQPFESAMRWEILGEIASGGMGRVELARTLGARSRLLAVKRLHAHLAADKRFVNMFLDEVWMTGALRHPNVIELAGWGEDDDGLVLAMEFVDGCALSHLWRAGLVAGDPISAELCAYVCARIADGLSAVHALTDASGASLEVVHRDVTPSNVLIGFDGAVKITDFGVARAVGRSTRTATGVLKGKVSYMSPEHARGARVDGRSDLYSLGVVLYELATGERPLEADHDLQTLALIAEKPAPPISLRVPEFPAPLVELARRLLAKSPAERPATGAAVAAELDRWLDRAGRRRAEMARALSAYAAKHAADRRAATRALLAAEGKVRQMRRVDGYEDSSPEDRTEIDDPPDFDPQDTTTKRAPKKDRTGPHTRQLQVPAAASAALEPAPPPGADDLDLSASRTHVMDARTQVLPPRAAPASLTPPSSPGVAASTPLSSSPPRPAPGAPQVAPVKAGLGYSSTVRLADAEPRRRRQAGPPIKQLLAVATLSFVLVAGILALVLVSLAR